MKQIKLILGVVLLVAVLVGASVLYRGLSDRAELMQARKAMEPAPDFTVTDRAGNLVKLSDFRGKPVVVNFWASWCGVCLTEMPVFEQAAKRHAGEVEFLMVNLTDGAQETVKTATEFLADHGYSFPVYFDTEQEAAMTYYVVSLPTTCFITADGKIQTRMAGAVSSQRMATEIRHLLE